MRSGNAPCNGTIQQQQQQQGSGGTLDRGHPGDQGMLSKEVEAGEKHMDSIYGLKKQCLYVMVTLCGLMALVNLALSVWIIKVLDLSSSGLGSLGIQPTGIKVGSDVEIFDTMFARHLLGPSNRNLQIESGGNVTITASDPKFGLKNRLTLGKGGLEAVGKHFIVRDDDGNVLFRVDPSEVLVAAEDVSISNSGGLRLDGSLETTLIRGDIAKDLRLESPRKMVKIQGDEEVHLESRAGQIKATCLQDIKLQAANTLVLDNLKLQIKNLATSWTASPIRGTSGGLGGGGGPRAKQVCACDNGRLFLAPAEGLCHAKRQVCLDPVDKDGKRAYV